MQPMWRLAWGKLGDSIAELSSVRELLDAKLATGKHRMSDDDKKILLDELSLVRRECARVERKIQALNEVGT